MTDTPTGPGQIYSPSLPEPPSWWVEQGWKKRGHHAETSDGFTVSLSYLHLFEMFHYKDGLGFVFFNENPSDAWGKNIQRREKHSVKNKLFMRDILSLLKKIIPYVVKGEEK